MRFLTGARDGTTVTWLTRETRLAYHFTPDGATGLMRSLDDSRDWRGYIAGMKSDPLELKEARAEYYARWEAVEAVKAQELAAMTEERARQIIQMLGAAEGWRERPDWSGLVEQQAIFQKLRHA